MDNSLKGKVKWFNNKKGFGFILCNGVDYFVHFRAIKAEGYKSLKEGDNVIFKANKSLKGMQAEDVIVVQ